MNETIQQQLKHRTIRFFKDEPVAKEIVDVLFDVFNHAASSTGMQQASIIRVTDPEIREEIRKVATQDYLAKCPELWIFVADIHRNAEIARAMGYTGGSYRDMDRFFQGFTDAVIGAQNVMVALESLGLGGVYFGSILNDYDRMVELLDLPALTFPVIGMGFGVIDDNPDLKPRMPKVLKLFENRYSLTDNIMEAIQGYDTTMTTYYDTRDKGRRSDSFTRQVVARFQGINAKRRNVMASIAKQGFDIEPK
ncbi:nitroreductase family protein [Peptoniphilus equinus]|uniref:Nitroreductase family protein n=1 Tax=Peptoniphilus equinus TaxID=3016343 RepID=A0ABY7QV50_9FIRM|nr:nitroreductase family protein [Peptoniphilus equinus]WBW50063.1 nitroreductase family protein [Peptoniphilus equinus]